MLIGISRLYSRLLSLATSGVYLSESVDYNFYKVDCLATQC